MSSIQHHRIPYGVIDFEGGGKVGAIKEKPEYTFTVNTGVYLLNRECLGYVPGKGSFDMPDLIEELIRKDKKVWQIPC